MRALIDKHEAGIEHHMTDVFIHSSSDAVVYRVNDR